MNYTTAQLPRREKNALRLELRRRPDVASDRVYIAAKSPVRW